MRHLKQVGWWLVTLWKLGSPPRHRKIAYNAKISGPVRIGDYTYIGGRTEIRAVLTAIEVGRYCSIGRDVKVFSSGQAHRFNGLSTYPFFQLDPSLDRRDFNVMGHDTVIGNDVWIGSNVVIQAGVRIGNGAVIGASSVVTRDVPPYTVVAGVPARPLHPRFPLDLVDRIEASLWWERDFDDLKSYYGEAIERNRDLADPGGFSWL